MDYCSLCLWCLGASKGSVPRIKATSVQVMESDSHCFRKVFCVWWPGINLLLEICVPFNLFWPYHLLVLVAQKFYCNPPRPAFIKPLNLMDLFCFITLHILAKFLHVFFPPVVVNGDVAPPWFNFLKYCFSQHQSRVQTEVPPTIIFFIFKLCPDPVV